MISFLLRRLAQSILTLVIISLLVFTALFAIGDPVAALLPPTATVRDREILRRDLGLDRSLPVQYAAFIGPQRRRIALTTMMTPTSIAAARPPAAL